MSETDYSDILKGNISEVQGRVERLEGKGVEINYEGLADKTERVTLERWFSEKQVEMEKLFQNQQECEIETCGETPTRLQYGSTPEEDVFLCRDHYEEK